MSFTPWVARPVSRTVATLMRTDCPAVVMSISSSSSETTVADTTFPVLSVQFMVLMPVPPRPCVRYSSKEVRLPRPFSEATSRVFCGSTMARATT